MSAQPESEQPKNEVISLAYRRMLKTGVLTGMDPPELRSCGNCGCTWFFSTIAIGNSDGQIMGRRTGVICTECGEESDV